MPIIAKHNHDFAQPNLFGGVDKLTPNFCSIAFEQGALKVVTPFNRLFLDDLKLAVPPSARTWRGDAKAWFVAVEHGEVVRDLISTHYDENVELPNAQTGASEKVNRIFTVDYIGRCKPRDAGLSAASGFANGDWKLVFPEEVLRRWFEGEQNSKSNAPATFYTLLGARQHDSPTEIKTAYKRAARSWHPDVCREPDAADKFREINKAYKLLSNPALRRRYDAGLAFEKLNDSHDDERINKFNDAYGYAPLLRCGNISIAGVWRTGKILVTDILAWDDVVNFTGEIMTSTWQRGADKFSVSWVNPNAIY